MTDAREIVAQFEAGIVSLYKNGDDSGSIARALGVSRRRVAGVLAKEGLTISRPRGRPRGWVIGERENEMACLYRSGLTLAEIGEKHGVSRERVRQILKYMGVSRRDGGQSERARIRRLEKKDGVEKRCREKYGCSRSQYKHLCEIGRNEIRAGVSPYRTPTRAFTLQKKNARERGIEWDFLLWDWWKVWRDSGLWEKRGREKGQYVMARFGDVGPYAVDNVSIVLNSQNIRDGHANHKAKKTACQKETPQ